MNKFFNGVGGVGDGKHGLGGLTIVIGSDNKNWGSNSGTRMSY